MKLKDFLFQEKVKEDEKYEQLDKHKRYVENLEMQRDFHKQRGTPYRMDPEDNHDEVTVTGTLEKAMTGENAVIRNQIEVIKQNFGRKYPMKITND